MALNGPSARQSWIARSVLFVQFVVVRQFKSFALDSTRRFPPPEEPDVMCFAPRDDTDGPCYRFVSSFEMPRMGIHAQSGRLFSSYVSS